MNSNFKKLISFLISYSLIFNNILYASSIVLLDVNKDTKIYDINEEDTTVIDIARPSDTLKKISLNLFKIFNTEKRKILINNSKVKIKSRLTNKEIEANQNYKNDEDISDIVIFFTPSEPKGSNLSSYFEILGNNKVDFIFSDPNGLISKGGQYINIRKLSLISGLYDNGNYKVLNNSAKISILPLENDSHLGINTGEVDELYLLSREINISGEIILKGLLSIETRVDNGDNKINKPKFSFQTSSFGNIQAGSIKLITLEPDTDVNITTSIITTMDDMIFNLNRNLLLSGNTAKLISERLKLTINAINLTLDNSSTISSYEDMTLTIKNSLLNTNKSLIHTQSGNIVMKLQELKNHNASIIQSGSELIINGKLIENVGINNNNGGTHITHYQHTGSHASWYNTVPYGKEMIDVSLTTIPSQILSKNTMKLNFDNLQNRSSEIISESKLIINGKVLNNERNDFSISVKYTTQTDYKKRGDVYIKWRGIWPEFFERHHQYETDHWNQELFYSNTPSIVMGDNIEIKLTDILTQDSRRTHQDKNFVQSGSRIEANNELKINSKRILNYGVLISSTGKEFINIEEDLSNVGGIIVSRKGGVIRTKKLNNAALVKQINIGGVSFNQEFIQPAAIGTSKDPKQLSITYEENKDNPSNPDNVMIIQAQEVQNISSYLIGMNGTMKVISKRFESITQEVRNRTKESGTLIETIQNYKSGIFGTNIELEIEETPIISGTDIKALESLKIKARQLAIREAQNKHFEEHRVVKEKTFSKSESHSIVSTTQAIQTRISAPKIEIETEDNIDMIAPIIEGEDISIVSKNGDVNIEDTKNKLLSYNYSYEEKTDLTSIIVSGATAALGSTVLVLLGMVPRELGVLTVTVSGVTGAFISLLENNQIAKEIIRKNHDEIIIKANINAKNLKIIAANKLLLPYQDAIIADNKDIRAFAGIKRYRLELVHELKEEINKSGTDYGLAIITGLISSGLVTCFIRSAFVPTITLSDSNGNSNTQPQLPFEFDSQDKNKSIEDDEDTLTISKNTINNNQITFLQNNPLLASNTTMPLPRVTDIETINQVRQLFEAAGIALLAGDTILVPDRI